VGFSTAIPDITPNSVGQTQGGDRNYQGRKLMSKNDESANVSAFTCEFGFVTLDLPFAQQPALQEFLNVPPAPAGKLVSDELLNRFLAIADCVLSQELTNSDPQGDLVSVNVGYEVWSVSDAEPLLESGWIAQNEISTQPQSEVTVTLVPTIERLMQRFREEALRRVDAELLLVQSLHILVYGTSILADAHFSDPIPRYFGVRSCSCKRGPDRYSENCQVKC